MRWRAGLFLLGCAGLLSSAQAAAQPADPGESEAPSSATPAEPPPTARAEDDAPPNRTHGDPGHPLDAPIASDRKRDVPDYDGREEPTTAGDVLIWVPRVIFSPLYFVSEFIVRRPLGALVTAVEEEKVVPQVIDFLTFGPEGNIGIVPTGLIDFGFRPSVGLYFFWNDFLHENNALRARAATWGPDWLLFNLKDRLSLDHHTDLTLQGEFLRRSDLVFHGLGPESGSERARFQQTKVEGEFGFETRLWRSSRFRSHVGIRKVNFDPTTGDADGPTVAQEVARGRFPLPPGMDDGYFIAFQGLSASLDSRPRRMPDWLPAASDYVSPPGTGVRFALRGEHAQGLEQSPQPTPSAPRLNHWVTYGATLGGFLDLGAQRVVGLSAIVDFAEPIDDGTTIPFTELISLGGERPMRGFLQGRLVGQSSAVAQFDYQWPIWVWIDGALHYSVGNVFGEQLDGFEAGLLRQSFGVGFKSTSSRDHVFEVLLAFGSDTFDAGGDIETVRFVLGATSGF